MRLHDEVYLLRSRSYIQRNDLANKTYIFILRANPFVDDTYGIKLLFV